MVDSQLHGIADVLGQVIRDKASSEVKDGLSRRYATVSQIKTDGTLVVKPDGSTDNVLCGRACNPKAGDRVVILVDGTQWVAVGTVGGDGGGVSLPVSVANGGTGGTSQLQAATNLNVLSLSEGTIIPANANLNTYTAPGTYSCNTTDTATLSNVPFTGFAITLIVERTYKNTLAGDRANYVLQTAWQHATAHQRRWKRYSSNAGSTWSAWILWSAGGAYSTTEQDTGKVWIDGKVIYRRVFTGTITAVAGEHVQTNFLPLTANHTYKLIDYFGTWAWGGIANDVMGIGQSYDNVGSYISGVICRVSGSPYGFSLITQNMGNARTNAPYQIWVEYTK